MKKLYLMLFIILSIISVYNSKAAINPTYVDSVVMRHGKKLAVDVYIPDGGVSNTYPAIQVQTLYNSLL